jgi:hypothetical protein
MVGQQPAEEEVAMRSKFDALLDAALAAEGISDVDAYLDANGEGADIMWPPSELEHGGSVHLAMRATISDKQIDKTLRRLSR